jgi:hypothetical protein
MNAEHLNGAINETLRLHPPVPSGLPRLTPPEGITIGDTFIPGDTTLMLPYWSMGRCSSPFRSLSPYLHPHPFMQGNNASDQARRSRENLPPRQRIHPRALVLLAQPRPS